MKSSTAKTVPASVVKNDVGVSTTPSGSKAVEESMPVGLRGAAKDVVNGAAVATIKAVVVPLEDTEIHTWFERDRAHVELRHTPTEKTIVEWRDEEVSQAIEDGFLSGGRGPVMKDEAFRQSAYEYAESTGLLDASRFYKGCMVDLKVHRDTVAKELSEPLSEQDLIHFMSLLDRILKEQLPGAKVSIGLAEVGSETSTTTVLDANKKNSPGVAEKVFQVFDECREDVSAWAGMAGVIDPKDVPSHWYAESGLVASNLDPDRLASLPPAQKRSLESHLALGWQMVGFGSDDSVDISLNKDGVVDHGYIRGDGAFRR